MNGYLTFLKSLSEAQQRAEIGHLMFTERRGGSSLEEDLLKMPAVVARSEMLGVGPSWWVLGLTHYAQEVDVIATPVFDEGQCRAPFRLRYRHFEQNLVVSGMIYIDDDQSALIGTVEASSSPLEKSCARQRLVEAGINPDTLETVAYDLEMDSKMPYLDYLQALLPQQRREEIVDLAAVVWGTNPGRADNPLFLRHPKIAPELRRLGIKELDIGDRCHEVGPVEFAGGRCTAPILYPFYGHSKNDQDGLGYYVEVHILAGIGNRSGGGGVIWMEDLWFRCDSIDDPPSDAIPLLVP